MEDFSPLLPALCEIARDAATLIMRHYVGDFTHRQKADHSPVTLADTEANALIVERLQQLTPQIPIISEEGEQPEVAAGSTFWLVDPLDGTRSYIARDGQFTVNIGLIRNHRPILGVMSVPAEDTLYYGTTGGVAYRQIGIHAPTIIQCRIPDMEGVDVITSKSHGSERMHSFLADYTVRNRIKAGSALKFCRVAEGVADIYPRLGETMEWDTAAGHCIVEAAGGSVLTVDGQPFLYGKKGYLNGGFVAWGKFPTKN